MITKIHLENFKAFKSLDIEVKPITVLLGEPNTGKTSILSAVRFVALANSIKQDTGRVPKITAFNEFGGYRSIVHEGKPFSYAKVSISLEDMQDISLILGHRYGQGKLEPFVELDYGFADPLSLVGNYLSALRNDPAYSHRANRTRQTIIGRRGENASEILITQTDDSLSQRVSGWLKGADLAGGVEVKEHSDLVREVLFLDLHSRIYRNLADAGNGLNSVLPVIVGGYNMPANSTYMVECPEVGLGVKAQAHLGSFFSSLYQEGVQSVIETNSDYLVMRLQQCVASGLVPAADVAVYYLCRSGGESTATRLRLDDYGRFTDGFPNVGLIEAENLARARFASRLIKENK